MSVSFGPYRDDMFEQIKDVDELRLMKYYACVELLEIGFCKGMTCSECRVEELFNVRMEEL